MKGTDVEELISRLNLLIFFFLFCKLKLVGDLGEAEVLERVMYTTAFMFCRQSARKKGGGSTFNEFMNFTL